MKRYQAIAFLLSTAMTVSSVAPVFGASSDVFGHWAEFTITKWQNEGRIGGYEDGTFRPDRAITRAEFVRLLNSAVPTAFTSSATINFSDVKESDWFYADVAKAVGGRVASGFEDGTFRPGETVTRMQAAVFICNAKGLTPNEAAANNFTDAASIPSWAKGAVGAAVAAGYLSGYPDGSFGGAKGMTRAEAVSTLDRVLGGGSTNTPQGEISTPSREDSNSDSNDVEDNRTAEAGNMVWTSGGSGSRRSSSSSGGGSSSSTVNTNNVIIRSQSDADDYANMNLKGTTKVYVPASGLEFDGIKFQNLEVHAQNTVKSAYIGEDTAVAPAYAVRETIIKFNGGTTVTGNLNIEDNDISDKVVIVVPTTSSVRKVASVLLAKVAAVIRGPVTLPVITAQAPVSIEEGASVSKIEAQDNASVTVDENSNVDTIDATGNVGEIILEGNTGSPTQVNVSDKASVESIEVSKDAEANVDVKGNGEVAQVSVSGNANANVAVNDTASVGNVAVSGNANADVAVKDTASVDKVELSDTATGSVDVAPEAKVDEINSTSTGKTEVSGEGTVSKIEATDPSTVDTTNAGDNVAEPTKPTTPVTPPTGGDVVEETTTLKAADLTGWELTTPKAGEAKTVKVKPYTNTTLVGTPQWTTTDTDANASNEIVAEKEYTAEITLKPDTGYAFDTTEGAYASLAGVGGITSAVVKDGNLVITVKVTAEKAGDVTGNTYAIKAADAAGTSITEAKPGAEITLSLDKDLPAGASIKYSAKWEEGSQNATITITGSEFTIPDDAKDGTITISGEITGVDNATVTPLNLTVKAEPAEEAKPTAIKVAAESNATTIPVSGNLTFTATLTGGADYTDTTTTNVKWTATKKNDANTTYTITGGVLDLTNAETVNVGDVIVVTATSTECKDENGNYLTGSIDITVVAAATTDQLKEKLQAVENGMQSDAVTVELSTSDDKTAAEAKIAAAAEKLVEGYSVTFEFDTEPDLTAETTTVSGRFTVKQTGASGDGVTSENAITVKVNVVAEKVTVATVGVTLTAPEVDGEPATTAEVAAADKDKYAVDASKGVTWKVQNATNEFEAFTGNFADGKVYQATVTLKAKEGYKFDSTTEATQVDGSKTTTIDPALTADATEITVVVTYDALATAPEGNEATAEDVALTFDNDDETKNVVTINLTGAKIKADYDLSTTGADKITVTGGTTLQGKVTKADPEATSIQVTFEEANAPSALETGTTGTTETFNVTIPKEALDAIDDKTIPDGGLEATITVTLTSGDQSDGTTIEADAIGTMSVTLTAGQKAPTTLEIANVGDKAAPVTGTISWAKEDGTALGADDKIEADTTYVATVTLTPTGPKDTFAEGFALTSEKVTVNGADVTISTDDEGLGLGEGNKTYTFTFEAEAGNADTTIAVADVDAANVGVAAPVADQNIVKEKDGTQYSVAAAWKKQGSSDADYSDVQEGDNQFAADTNYKVTITLTAKPGYKFSTTENYNIQIGEKTATAKSADGTTLVFEIDFSDSGEDTAPNITGITGEMSGVVAGTTYEGNEEAKTGTLTVTSGTTSATTIDLTAAIANIPQGANVVWAFDGNTIGAKFADGGSGADTVTSTVTEGAATVTAQLKIPADVDVATDKTVIVKATYTSEDVDPAVTKEATLTITLKKGSQTSYDTVIASVEGTVKGTIKEGSTDGAISSVPGENTFTVTLNGDYKFATFSEANNNATDWFTAPAGSALTDAGIEVTATNKGNTDDEAKVAILTVSAKDGSKLTSEIKDAIALAIPKDVIKKSDDADITLEGDKETVDIAAGSAKFNITKPTAETVDTVSITGLNELTDHNKESFNLPTLAAGSSDDYEAVTGQTTTTWKLFDGDSGTEAQAFDKPGTYKADFTLEIKEGVEKTFNSEDVTVELDAPTTGTGFTVTSEKEIVSSSQGKQLKVTVTVQVAEAEVTEGKELSISYDKGGNNELTWTDENLTGATLGTLSNDLEFTQTDNDKLNGVTVKLTVADNKITFNAGSTTLEEGKTYTFKATIPKNSLTLKAGYALATDAQGIDITVSVTVPTSSTPGSSDVQNQEEPSAGV